MHSPRAYSGWGSWGQKGSRTQRDTAEGERWEARHLDVKSESDCIHTFPTKHLYSMSRDGAASLDFILVLLEKGERQKGWGEHVERDGRQS